MEIFGEFQSIVMSPQKQIFQTLALTIYVNFFPVPIKQNNNTYSLIIK